MMDFISQQIFLFFLFLDIKNFIFFYLNIKNFYFLI